MKFDMKAIGERVRLIRGSAGWAQLHLATALGMSVDELSEIESGDADPHMTTVLALAEELGISPMWLVGEIS